jgi:hypothetical protein
VAYTQIGTAEGADLVVHTKADASVQRGSVRVFFMEAPKFYDTEEARRDPSGNPEYLAGPHEEIKVVGPPHLEDGDVKCELKIYDGGMTMFMCTVLCLFACLSGSLPLSCTADTAPRVFRGTYTHIPRANCRFSANVP